jgi:hypothetical protein
MLKEPPLKSYTIHGSAVRDIPILPDRISPDPEGWLCEYWYRMDPRIQYRRDIEPRIRPDLRPKHATRFLTSRLRFRRECHLLGWLVKRTNFVSERTEILEAATKAGIDVEATNSTRGLSWGLVDPAKGEAGGRIPVSKSLRRKKTREDVQSARNLLCTSGSNGVLPAASNPRALWPTPALRAQIDYARNESPLPEQAVSLTLHNSAATTSRKHVHDEADLVHILEAQRSSRQATLPELRSASEQSISPVARPYSTKQSEMLPAQCSAAQGCLEHDESSLRYRAIAGLDEENLEFEAQILNTPGGPRSQQFYSLYLGESGLVELGEPPYRKSPHSSSQSKPSNVCKGDAHTTSEFISDKNSAYVVAASEMSHVKASDVYEGYARPTEQFFLDESGTYVPLLSKDIPPRTSQRCLSVSASVYDRTTPAGAHQGQEKVGSMEQHYHPRQANTYSVHQTKDGARLAQHTEIFPPPAL